MQKRHEIHPPPSLALQQNTETASGVRQQGSGAPTPYRTVMEPLLQRVNTYMKRWAGRKYKRLRTIKRFKRWWTGLLQRAPGLFAHWRVVRSYA